MQYEFGVTIATDLHIVHGEGVHAFAHVHVIDLREAGEGKSFSVDIGTAAHLSQWRIGYERRPIDMDRASARQENELYLAITEQGGNVLILTDQAASVTRFCNGLDIPSHKHPGNRGNDNCSGPIEYRRADQPDFEVHAD